MLAQKDEDIEYDIISMSSALRSIFIKECTVSRKMIAQRILKVDKNIQSSGKDKYDIND